MVRYDATYWDELNAAIADSPWCSAPNFQTMESPQWWDMLVTYVKGRDAATLHQRSGMDSDVVRQLREAEDRAAKAFSDDCMPLVLEWSHHFMLRDEIQDMLTQDFRRPAAHTLYMIYGRKD